MNQLVQPLKESKVERLTVLTYQNRQDLGVAAGKSVAVKIRDLLAKQKFVQIVFAAAPSQNEFLDTLVREKDIDWNRVIAFHLDEYIGISENTPQSFRKYLKDHLFSVVKPGQVHYLNGNAPVLEEECSRYGQLLTDYPLDIACIGIGENGHLAFNDPPVADFLDPQIVKIVELDARCRRQQIHDGCFSNLNEVPRQALSLTIPTIFSSRYIFCMVPGTPKAEAIRETTHGAVSSSCPATVLRRHLRAVLFLDQDSAALL